MTRKEYCNSYCPERFDSECFVACHLDIEEREERIREMEDCDDDEEYDDDET